MLNLLLKLPGWILLLLSGKKQKEENLMLLQNNCHRAHRVSWKFNKGFSL